MLLDERDSVKPPRSRKMPRSVRKRSFSRFSRSRSRSSLTRSASLRASSSRSWLITCSDSRVCPLRSSLLCHVHARLVQEENPRLGPVTNYPCRSIMATSVRQLFVIGRLHFSRSDSV